MKFFAFFDKLNILNFKDILMDMTWDLSRIKTKYDKQGWKYLKVANKNV